MKRVLLFGVAGLAAVLIATGCGSSGDSQPVTKAEFIKEAEAACAQRQEKAHNEFISYAKKAVEQKASQAEKEAQAAEATEGILIPALRGEVEDIRALTAPQRDTRTIEQILSAIESGIRKAEEDPAAALGESPVLFARSSQLAEEYGLERCGDG